MGHKINLGDSVHCKELVSGHQLTGRFTYSRDEGLKTTLFSYDEYIHIEPDAPLYLHTEQLEVISLFDSFGGAGNRWRGEPSKVVHIHKISSNIAIAGIDKWTIEDRVKRVGFSVPEALWLLTNDKKIERLNMSRIAPKDDDWLVLDLKVQHKRIRLSYQAEYIAGGNEPKKVTPRFEIEFDKPVELREYVSSMQEVLSFLSFSLGIRVSPHDISVSRISLQEYLESVSQQKYVEDHRDLSLWTPDKVESGEGHIGDAPVFAHKVEDLEALGRNLVAWVDRANTWFDAYLLMLVCFSKRKEVSGERLLAACKWLEKIPSAKPQKSLRDEDLNSIIDAAFAAAQKVNKDIKKQRINGALKSVSNESRDQHMQRLLSLAWGKHQLPRPMKEFVHHLKAVQRLRGKAAHSLLDLSEENEFRECARAIMALEALCFMLMTIDLPLADDGRSRLLGHRAISDYRNII